MSYFWLRIQTKVFFIPSILLYGGWGASSDVFDKSITLSVVMFLSRKDVIGKAMPSLRNISPQKAVSFKRGRGILIIRWFISCDISLAHSSML